MIKRSSLLDGMVALVGSFALLFAAISLRWPVIHDLPILLYEGFLVREVGLVPYRDFFDVNAPGALLLFGAIHQLTAGSPLACRLLDLGILAALGALSCFVLRRHGIRAGALAASAFSVVYLSTGPENALQREYLCLLPLAASIALTLDLPNALRGRLYPFFLCGLMAGSVTTIKPPIVLCWLPLLAHAGVELDQRGDWWKLAKAALCSLAGFLLPIFSVLLWLHLRGGLSAYLDVVRNYYPLYTHIDGNGVIQKSGLEGFTQRLLMTAPLFRGPLALAAVLGITAGRKLQDRRLWKQNAALAGLVLSALLYVTISGKFWEYHKYPLFYAMSLCAGIAFSRALPEPETRPKLKALALMAAMVLSLPIVPFATHFMSWKSGSSYLAADHPVAVMADYLRRHTTAEDSVAPLDTTTGALNALYRARRPLYGRFLNDFHFYHDGASPYIVGLRRELLAQFQDGKPTVLLQCKSWRPKPARPEDNFPELDEILRSRFVAGLDAADCTVWRRR